MEHRERGVKQHHVDHSVRCQTATSTDGQRQWNAKINLSYDCTRTLKRLASKKHLSGMHLEYKRSPKINVNYWRGQLWYMRTYY